MAKVRRQDVMKLDASKRTREGYIDTFGNLTRVGVFEYRRDDGTIQRELRLPEHVFSAEAIASAHGQPLTLNHPNTNLDAKTFRSRAAGIVLDPHKSDDGVHLRARVRVMDEEAVRAVECGMRELSNGYETDLVPIPGGVFQRDDVNGGVEVKADVIQTNILINHTALVPLGRAGRSARLDSAGNQGEAETMTEEEKKALADAIALAAAEKARADGLAGQVAAFQAAQRADAELKAKVAKSALAARVSSILKKDAAEIEKIDDVQIYRECLAVLAKNMDTADWGVDALRGAFEVAALGVKKDAATDMTRVVLGAKTMALDSVEDDENASELAFQKSRKDAANAWRVPSKVQA